MKLCVQIPHVVNGQKAELCFFPNKDSPKLLSLDDIDIEQFVLCPA